MKVLPFLPPPPLRTGPYRQEPNGWRPNEGGGGVEAGFGGPVGSRPLTPLLVAYGPEPPRPHNRRGLLKGPRGPLKGSRGPLKGPRDPFKEPRGPFKWRSRPPPAADPPPAARRPELFERPARGRPDRPNRCFRPGPKPCRKTSLSSPPRGPLKGTRGPLKDPGGGGGKNQNFRAVSPGL